MPWRRASSRTSSSGSSSVSVRAQSRSRSKALPRMAAADRARAAGSLRSSISMWRPVSARKRQPAGVSSSAREWISDCTTVRARRALPWLRSKMWVARERVSSAGVWAPSMFEASSATWARVSGARSSSAQSSRAAKASATGGSGRAVSRRRGRGPGLRASRSSSAFSASAAPTSRRCTSSNTKTTGCTVQMARSRRASRRTRPRATTPGSVWGPTVGAAQRSEAGSPHASPSLGRHALT